MNDDVQFVVIKDTETHKTKFFIKYFSNEDRKEIIFPQCLVDSIFTLFYISMFKFTLENEGLSECNKRMSHEIDPIVYIMQMISNVDESEVKDLLETINKIVCEESVH